MGAEKAHSLPMYMHNINDKKQNNNSKRVPQTAITTQCKTMAKTTITKMNIISSKKNRKKLE